ncbi:MAG: hypothetical protein Q8K92_26495 [Leadbetterella sp.]|nr:hypothetical protein [Leadbetterella sp.]
MKKVILKSIFATMFGIISLTNSSAQEQENSFKNGVEINILFPIYPGNEYAAKYTRVLWQKDQLKGELLLGLNVHPEHFRETEGKFSDYALSTGYRQYFWKGLFVEYSQLNAFSSLKNHVTTGKDYNSFALVSTGTAGYKYSFGKSKRIYSILQMGIAKVVYKDNPWPILEDNTLQKEVGETPFLYGGVQIGINF